MKHGFSLVELSIVLVILGLLTGGILTGQSLIRAAEIRSVTTQLSQYHAALYTFRDKYYGLPGDLTNATAFWGIAAGSTGNDATCYAASGTGTATCNGNGNGYIHGAAVNYVEIFRAWQHLTNAGMVEGTYTGLNDDASNSDAAYVAGENTPACKITNCRISLIGLSNGWAEDANYFAQPAGNRFDIRGTSGNAGPLTPAETWGIDKKIDDGLPTFGKFRVNHKMSGAFAPNCTDSNTAAGAGYRLEDDTKRCGPTYYM